MRFSPNALIFTKASDFPAFGLGISALMNRAEASPFPPLISESNSLVVSVGRTPCNYVPTALMVDIVKYVGIR